MLAEYLLAEAVSGADRPQSAPRRRSAVTDEPIAIVGMAAGFPGGVATPEELWAVGVRRSGRGRVVFPDGSGLGLSTALYRPGSADVRAPAYAREGGFLHDAAGVRRGVLRDLAA